MTKEEKADLLKSAEELREMLEAAQRHLTSVVANTPKPNNRTVVFLLKSVFLYSENPSSHEHARQILLEYSTGRKSSMDAALAGNYGGFMRAICQGDFFTAYQLGDSLNQDALAIGMRRYLQPVDQTNLYDDGLEPSDYLPATVDVKK